MSPVSTLIQNNADVILHKQLHISPTSVSNITDTEWDGTTEIVSVTIFYITK
ncbi:MAG: hypothetical protein IPO94_18910 [Saprospiraceae bacterium]|nr:hypothetical protein [Saprospiraceae bacterium]